jgi:hypothetical protein
MGLSFGAAFPPQRPTWWLTSAEITPLCGNVLENRQRHPNVILCQSAALIKQAVTVIVDEAAYADPDQIP